MKYKPYHHERPNYFLIVIIALVAFLGVYLVLLKNPKLILKTPLVDGLTSSQKFFQVPTVLSEASETTRQAPHDDHTNQVRLKHDHAYLLDKELSPSFIFPEKWSIQKIKNPKYSIDNNYLVIEKPQSKSIYINNLYTLEPWMFGSIGKLGSGPSLSPQIKNNFLYWVDQNEAIFKVQLDSKKIIWTKKLSKEQILNFHIDEKQSLYLFEKNKDSLLVKKLDANQGQLVWQQQLGKNEKIYQTQSDQQFIFIYTDQHFFKLDTKTGSIDWKVPSLAPVKSPLLISKSHIAVATTDGQLYSLKKSTGEKIWEYNMERPAKGKLTFIPRFNRISVMTNDGYIHTVDAFTGERRWRLKIKTTPVNTSLQSVKLNGNAIRKLSLDWGKKGWTIWGGCALNRLCVFNPKDGQILAKYSTPTKILTAPRFFKNNFTLLVANQDNRSHPKLVFFLNP